MDTLTQYKLLIDILKNLSLASEEQRSILPDFVIEVEEELIDDFFNAFRVLPQLIDEGYLKLNSVSAILRCYIYIRFLIFDSINPKTELKKGFKILRELAHEALKTMEDPELN